MAASCDIVAVVSHVPAIVIVHVAVVVIVNAVVGHFTGVRPVVVDEVGVAVIGAAAFEDGHDDAHRCLLLRRLSRPR